MKPHPKEAKAKILFNRRVTANTYRLRFLCPEIARFAQPGQFVMLRLPESRDPLLRRPFSFSRISPPQGKKGAPEEDGILEIIYKVMGRGTALMVQMREGQRVDLLGPLGKGFWEVDPGNAILVGGGMGIAPLISWAEELAGKTRGRKKSEAAGEKLPKVLVLIGGKSKEGLIGIREFRRMGLTPEIATDDGSMGIQGLATDLLERALMSRGRNQACLYACGPLPMLSRVAEIAQQFDLPCQVLLESRMACGLGACLGCAVKVREAAAEDLPVPVPEEGGAELREGDLLARRGKGLGFRYALTCQDGPVFDAREVFWG